MIQQTSREAYRKLENIGQKQLRVFESVERNGKVANYDIAQELGWPINRVTPRVVELREMDLIEQSHKDRHPVTDRTVIYWRVKHDQPYREPVQTRLI